MFSPRDEDVPRFGFVSSIIVVGSMFVAAALFPMLLNYLGLDLKWLRVIVAAATGAISVGYVLFFRETDRGFTKGLYGTVIATFAILALICYFWFYYVLV